jgi:hypothetical protein
MSKQISISKINFKEFTGVLPVSKGGTGATSPGTMAPALNAFGTNERNVPNGFAGLDANRKLNPSVLPDGLGGGIGLTGPVSVTVSSSHSYTITNYSALTVYTVSVSAGTVSRSGDTITFVAPGTAQSVTMTVNGNQYVIDVTPITAYVNTPSVTAPVNGATDQGPVVSMTSSAFATTGGSDTHEGSDWQLATDAGFSNIVASVTNSASDKVTWSSGALAAASTFYVRVRHKGATMGYSNWSSTVMFSTKASYIPNTEEGILVASDKAAGDQFGYSVSINSDGSRVVIGAVYADPGGTTSAGKAYIFARSGNSWSEEAILVASDKAVDEYFGYSVSINSDGSRVVIGAAYADPGGTTSAGKAYIFARSGNSWSQEAILVASDKADSDQFGYSVSINSDGSRVVIGAAFADPGGTADAGKAYIFARSGNSWSEEAILVASYKATSDYFGWSVSINSDGSRVVIGAAYADPGGITSAGKAYIFARSGNSWSEEAILVASDKANSDYFGYSVSINSDGSRVVIGAAYADPGATTSAGKAYIFARSGNSWSEEAILVASDKAVDDYFGYSVSINSDGSRVVIGARLADPGGTANAGKAYIFARSGNSWSEEAILVASDKAVDDYFGYSVSINSDGSRVVIGAHYADPGGTTNAGKAYILS